MSVLEIVDDEYSGLSSTFAAACRRVDSALKAKQQQTAKRTFTPQTTVEAIMYSVRTRGLPALNEPETSERLRRCDDAARHQINSRIATLDAAGRLPKGKLP
jgi:hypothetical protein